MNGKKFVFTDSRTGEQMTEREFIEHAEEVFRSPKDKKPEYRRGVSRISSGLYNYDPVPRYLGDPYEPMDNFFMTVFIRFPLPCPVCGRMPVVESSDEFVGEVPEKSWRVFHEHVKEKSPLRFWSVHCDGEVPIHHSIETRKVHFSDVDAIDEWNQAASINEQYTLEQMNQFKKFYWKEDEYSEEGKQ